MPQNVTGCSFPTEEYIHVRAPPIHCTMIGHYVFIDKREYSLKIHNRKESQI